ncbi:MAG TPA: CBS domain-containing protein [Candidatus Nanoarchaeia archaeon]|nr:CBS domain-containing protein [Candidatus Nanoarchaeia archaeon]
MKTGISVRDAMTMKPITARLDTNIQECARMMKKAKVGSIIVIDKNNLVGIISEKDIVERVIAKGIDFKNLKAKDVMTKELVTIDPKEDIYDALILMGNEEIRKLPVIENEKLVGLLTSNDILKIEPALFDIMSVRTRLREEHRKPIMYVEGRCDNCGFQGPVIKSKQKYLCISCKT